ncbi:MAG: hypothetical protein NVS1B4_14320 [Gemmatimonadaceae bacterium]
MLRAPTVAIGAVLSVGSALASCSRPDASAAVLPPAERAAIADTLTRLIAGAYDFSRPDVVERLLALYPTEGPVVSAAAGRVTTTRAELERGIRQFWDNVGRNMRDPKWTWGDIHAEVISRDAAILTATYTVPHRTPSGMPHTVGGALTALFERRGGRWLIVQEHLSDAPAAAMPESTAHH